MMTSLDPVADVVLYHLKLVCMLALITLGVVLIHFFMPARHTILASPRTAPAEGWTSPRGEGQAFPFPSLVKEPFHVVAHVTATQTSTLLTDPQANDAKHCILKDVTKSQAWRLHWSSD